MSDTTSVDHLVEQIKPMLAGHAAPIQGAVLADLLAIWLAGHIVRNQDDEIDRKQTDSLRERLLRSHIAGVKKLVAPNEKIIHGD